MARLARVVAVGEPHHITQRGNNRQDVFRCDADRVRYLELLKLHADQWGIELLGYCLMDNHVHLVATPRQSQSLARGIGRAHYHYTREFNQRNRRSGHLWQNRFYSCPLAGPHLLAALRYVDLNPVRAGLVEQAGEYRWSSAGAHLGLVESETLDSYAWDQIGLRSNWDEYLCEGATNEELDRLGEATLTDRPLGDAVYVGELEAKLGRPLQSKGRGRPKRMAATAGS